MDDSTKKNCAAGLKRDTSFADLKLAVQSFVNLVCGTSMPSKKDAMDIDQIGERENEESWGKENWWGYEWGGDTQGDQGGLNSLTGKGNGTKVLRLRRHSLPARLSKGRKGERR